MSILTKHLPTNDLEKDKWLFHHGAPINFKIPEGVTGPIHCLGDSHINLLTEVFPQIFESTRYSSISAYAVGSRKENEYVTDSLSRIPNGAKVLCCFGEIDCRHYVPKFSREQNRTVVDIVTEIVERYTVNFLGLLQQKYRVIAQGPHVCPDDHKHTCVSYGAEVPVWSNSFDQILEAKTLFNKLLKEFCDAEGILFIPMFYRGREYKWDELPVGTYFNDSSHLGPCAIPVILEYVNDYKWKDYDY